MKKALVTGAHGQLGKCLQEVVKPHSDIEFIYVDLDVLDITNENAVTDFFSDKNFDFCINCAAYTAVDKAEAEQDIAYKVNAEGVKFLSQACLKYNTTLIHISTDFVFDGQSNVPYNEEDNANPISVYGKTKLEGELFIQDILKQYFIIRTSWLYSEYGSNFMKTMLKLGNERDELSVVSDQIGTPTYAKDLAQIIFDIIKQDKKAYGLYHFSNEGVASWYDFSKAIFDLAKVNVTLHPIPSEKYPTPAKRPHFSVLDKNKIKQNLKTQTFHWTDSLKEALRNAQIEL